MRYINYRENAEFQAGIIEINRAQDLNALNAAVIDDLEQTLNIIQKSNKIRSVIITGAGEKAFVAGADIKEFSNFTEREGLSLTKSGKSKLFNKISNFSKPIIAAINGYALGGGLELALSAHIRVAGLNAKLGLPECSLGLIPGYGGTQRLPRIIGLGRATEMILTGKIMAADEALSIGLVSFAVPKEDLIKKCLEISKSFQSKSPEALRSAIKSINNCFYEQGDLLESKEFSKLFKSDNFKEGVQAFLEKRKANFNQ